MAGQWLQVPAGQPAILSSSVSVATEALLTAFIGSTLTSGTIARVASHRSLWVLDKAGGAAPTANRVISAAGGGTWTRLSIADWSYAGQFTWFYGPGGSNEADGLTAGTRLLEYAEIDRRTFHLPLLGNTIVWVTGSTSEVPVINRLPNQNAALFFSCTPTVIASGIAVGTIVTENKATNTEGTLQLPSIAADGWTSLGYLDHMIRFRNGGGAAIATTYAQKDMNTFGLGAKTCQLGTLLNFTDAPSIQANPGTTAGAATVDIIGHPCAIPTPIINAPVTVVYHGMGVAGTTGPLGVNGAQWYAQICEFDSRMIFNAQSPYSNLVACATNGLSMGLGSNGMLNQCYCGPTTALAETGTNSDGWLINDYRVFGRAIAPIAEWVIMKAHVRSGTGDAQGIDLGLWDLVSGVVIFNSDVTFNNLWGRGNGAGGLYPPVHLRMSGNRVAFANGAVTGGVSNYPPQVLSAYGSGNIMVNGVPYAWAALPVNDIPGGNWAGKEGAF